MCCRSTRARCTRRSIAWNCKGGLPRMGVSDNNRQAKFYRLTRSGQRQLLAEAAQWDRVTGAVALVMRADT